jgi:hypothetical protein
MELLGDVGHRREGLLPPRAKAGPMSASTSNLPTFGLKKVSIVSFSSGRTAAA